MPLSKERISYLLQQYSSRKATKAEEHELYTWVNENDNPLPVQEHIQQLIEQYDKNERVPRVEWEEVYQRIVEKSRPKPVVRTMTWTRVAAAAIVIVMLGVGSYFLFAKQTKHIAKVENKEGNHDVAPGGNRAVLTLANGSQIVLDSAANGTLTQQGNTKIIKLDSGQLAYQPVTLSGAKGLDGEVTYNTISTPKGGQYQIVLADGSKVWLNAASSLKFPISFTGKERVVELTGEGYFEVAHNAAKPFTVAVNGIEVHDIGTAFNINAYDDEATIKTTLLEGSVKVSDGSISKMIKPGQQAQIVNHANLLTPKITVQAADIDEAVAWKNGLFQFKNASIETIMRQVSRWYNVEVVYEGKQSLRMSGIVSRNINLSEVLKLLESNGARFTTVNKKIIVLP